MPSWELEQAADDLRRRQPEAWAAFVLALERVGNDAARILIQASPADVLVVQGEVRALTKLASRLAHAAETVQQLAGGKNNAT